MIFYWVDKDGNRRINSDAANELSAAIGETVRKQLENLKVPVTIEGQTANQSFKLSNLNLHTQVPQKINFHMETDASFSTANPKENRLTTEVTLTASIVGIKLNAKNINFDYKSPVLNESGVMDVTVPSLSVWIDFVYSPEQSQTTSSNISQNQSAEAYIKSILKFMRVESTVRLESLDISYHTETLNHKIMVPMLTKMFQANLKSQLETSITDAVNDSFSELGRSMENMIDSSSSPLSLFDFDFSSSSSPSETKAKVSANGYEAKVEIPTTRNSVL